jgi:hypothetical protein
MPVDLQLIENVVVSVIDGRLGDAEGCHGQAVEGEGVTSPALLPRVRS